MSGKVVQLTSVSNYLTSCNHVTALQVTQGKRNLFVWKTDPSFVMGFLTNAFHDLINMVVVEVPLLTDQKATVLAAVSTLYDRFFAPILPIWISIPFGPAVKNFVINVVFSNLFDYVVAHLSPTPVVPVVPVVPPVVPVVPPVVPVVPPVTS